MEKINNTSSIVRGIQTGANTQNQDHVITPKTFNNTDMANNILNSKKPIFIFFLILPPLPSYIFLRKR